MRLEADEVELAACFPGTLVEELAALVVSSFAGMAEVTAETVAGVLLALECPLASWLTNDGRAVCAKLVVVWSTIDDVEVKCMTIGVVVGVGCVE